MSSSFSIRVGKAALAALPACLLAASVAASPIDVQTGPPRVSAGFAFLNYFEFGATGDLSSFGASVDTREEFPGSGALEIGFGLSFNPADPVATSSGSFEVFGGGSQVLTGNISETSVSENLAAFELTNLGGSSASAFADGAIAEINFSANLGPQPLAALVDGSSYIASLEVAAAGVGNGGDNGDNGDGVPAPIPLPASLPLVLAGLCGLAAIRRRQAR